MKYEQKRYFATAEDYARFMTNCGKHILPKDSHYTFVIEEFNWEWYVIGDGVTTIFDLPKMTREEFDLEIMKKIETLERELTTQYRKVPENVLREMMIGYYNYLAFQQGGVDNWEWAGDSISNFVNDAIVVEEKHFDSIEDIVDHDMKSYPII